MKYRIVCDKSNNGYKEELEEVVNCDFHFEGVRNAIRVVFCCTVPEADFKMFRDDLFWMLPMWFEQFEPREVADWVNSELVKSQNGYAKKSR